MDYPIWLVCVMGMGIVFFGLICIIVLSSVMSAIIRLTEKKKSAADAPSSAHAVPQAAAMSPDEKGRVVAAVSAAIAEELGTGVEAIRITSIKRV